MAGYDYIALQQEYGGQYVATRDGVVVANAKSLGELYGQIRGSETAFDDLIVDYVEPPRHRQCLLNSRCLPSRLPSIRSAIPGF